MLVTVIALGTLVSALVLMVLAKADRSAQACAALVIVLTGLYLLQGEVQFIDKLLNRTVLAVLGIAILALAITAAIRVKDQLTGSVLVTLATLLAGVLTRIL